MLALSFSFPGHRYHATPWGRHVNEADVAWPPEPWRILRALIAAYWRKGACVHWPTEEAASLIDALAAAPPIFHLPEDAVHAHTRHYMPAPSKKTLVFDAFAHLPEGAAIVAAWTDLVLEPPQFELVSDLADAIGYLGRAESWVECTATAAWDAAQANCLPLAESDSESGDVVEVLAPLTAPRLCRAAGTSSCTSRRRGTRRRAGCRKEAADRTRAEPETGANFRRDAAGAPHRRLGYRYGGFPETRLEPPAGGTPDPLPPASPFTPFAPRHGSPGSCVRPLPLYGRTLSARRAPATPHRGRGQDWRAYAVRRTVQVRLGTGPGHGAQDTTGATRDLRARRGQQAAARRAPRSCLLAAGRCRRRRPDRPRVRLRRNRIRHPKVRTALDRLTRLVGTDRRCRY